MSPETAGAIQAIAERNGGCITPDMVVEAARNPASPLHEHFTWDIREAARERWREQARALIRAVRVEVTTTDFTYRVPVFVRDPVVPENIQGYVSLGRLRTDEELAREALVAEFARAAAVLARARAIAAALGLADEIEEVRERVLRLSGRASQAEVSAAV